MTMTMTMATIFYITRLVFGNQHIQ